MKTLRAYQPEQTLLLPPSIEEWLPEGAPGAVRPRVATDLDLAAIDNTYTEDRGQRPCHPRLMVTLLLYAYSTGTCSSRRMAARLADDVAQVIVSQHVTPSAPKVDEVFAEAGYGSEANAGQLATRGVDACLARGRMKHGEPAPPPTRGPIPAKRNLAERMQRKLWTKAGRAVYARRKAIVEPFNGQIKQARGFRQFLHRGVERVSQEWSLVCTEHNLRKLRAAWRPA